MYGEVRKVIRHGDGAVAAAKFIRRVPTLFRKRLGTHAEAMLMQICSHVHVVELREVLWCRVEGRSGYAELVRLRPWDWPILSIISCRCRGVGHGMGTRHLEKVFVEAVHRGCGMPLCVQLGCDGV